mmetsp:Transcript_28785/g.92215  ORF Transcript_28785/g.92215 Transcript_28785/m.92215 type:complete len:306 (+) Transcript_28785:182-1099(+)
MHGHLRRRPRTAHVCTKHCTALNVTGQLAPSRERPSFSGHARARCAATEVGHCALVAHEAEVGVVVVVVVRVLVLLVARVVVGAAPRAAQPRRAAAKPRPRGGDADHLLRVHRAPHAAAATRDAAAVRVRLVELHLIRRHQALRHKLVAEHDRRHRAARPVVVLRPHPALHLVPNLEAQQILLELQRLGRAKAVVERVGELLRVEVLADEHHLGLSRLALGPRLGKDAVQLHVYRVVDKLLVGVRDGQHALHAVKVGALLVEELIEPRLRQEEGAAELATFRVCTCAPDSATWSPGHWSLGGLQA